MAQQVFNAGPRPSLHFRVMMQKPCPQNRSDSVATQAMLIVGDNRNSQLSLCLKAAHNFFLSQLEAQTIIDRWNEVCDLARLSTVEKNYSWKR